MGSKWSKVSIDALKSTTPYSCVGGPFGSSLSRKHYEESGVPVIRGVNLSGDEFKDRDFVYVSEEKGEELRRNLAYPGDLVFTQRGTLGQVALIPEDVLFSRYVVSQSQMKLSVNPDVADAYFLYLYFRTQAAKKRIEKSAIVGGVPHINLGILKGFEVDLPPLPIQKKITALCKSFDKKIILNTQVNKTLEQMAQTLFKSWFVDFDPVRQNMLNKEQAKMNGEQPKGMDAPFLSKEVASLFPEKLVETDMGEIPEGWQLVPVGKLLSKTIGGDWGKEEPDAKHTEKVRIVRGTDIPKLHGGAIESVPVRYVEAKKLKTRKLERGDIVIEVSGGSKDQPTGRSLFISDNILKRLELPSEPASFCRRFQPVNYEVGLLLAVHFQLMYKAGKTWEYQNQSTGISNFQTTYFLEAEHVVVPSQEVLDAFVKQVSQMMDMIHSNQNIELTKLRDTLLPKLLSGEIDLENLQVEQAKALVD